MKTFQLPYLFIFLLIVSCAATSSIDFDYDIDEDFNSHNTFVICEDDLLVEHSNYPDYDNASIREYLSQEVSSQVENLGLTVDSTNPDVQVGFRLVISEETATFRDCSEFSEFNYWRECTIETETYTDETLIIYMSNLEKNQIIWQASMPCNMNISDTKLKSHIAKTVKTLFETYPNIVKPIE
ncbi:DUF4136 domain-containing protein [uncultured Psychroserpens sp.]|uniref:DUF4136 domain-containing protein n=1 Tax=uncultured Psychroserpens sp. TaxID=255436 RepID=UPI0026315A60|nr:DUF4136 domain-containing protein [uncultured Psychroserpens sp.]